MAKKKAGKFQIFWKRFGNFKDFVKKMASRKEDVKCILQISHWEWVSADMAFKTRLNILVIL